VLEMATGFALLASGRWSPVSSPVITMVVGAAVGGSV
jgi:hypothetical protein